VVEDELVMVVMEVLKVCYGGEEMEHVREKKEGKERKML
jgi:hypothetical protein